MNKNYQVFISYRHDGGEALGRMLYDRLTEMGYNVFYDVESLRSGAFNTKLFEVIDGCTDVLVVLPPSTSYCNMEFYVNVSVEESVKEKTLSEIAGLMR